MLKSRKVHLVMYVEKESLCAVDNTLFFFTILLDHKLHINVSCIVIFHPVLKKLGQYIAEIYGFVLKRINHFVF